MNDEFDLENEHEITEDEAAIFDDPIDDLEDEDLIVDDLDDEEDPDEDEDDWHDEEEEDPDEDEDEDLLGDDE